MKARILSILAVILLAVIGGGRLWDVYGTPVMIKINCLRYWHKAADAGDLL